MHISGQEKVELQPPVHSTFSKAIMCQSSSGSDRTNSVNGCEILHQLIPSGKLT